MTLRLVLVGAALALGGCLDLFEGSWFTPEALDAYSWPHNLIPADHVELVQLGGTAIEGEEEAPTLFGVWAKQCLDEVCLASLHPERQGVTILYFHGNAANLDRYWDRIQILWRLGFSVFALDYRGYGRSTGAPSEEGIYADAVDARRHVRERAGSAPVVYYGYSLGSTAAVDLGTEQPPAALVLEAPLASAQAFVDDAIGAGISAKTLMDAEFDNLAKIPHVMAPLLVVHGVRDDFVRVEFGEKVYDAARGPKRFWPVAESGHGNVPCPGRDPELSPEEDPCIATEAYDATVADFLADHLEQ